MSIIKAADIRLKIRPVLLGLEHKYFYEGPCRFGQGEALQPGFDKFANEDLFTMFLSQLDKYKPEGVDVLEPVRIGRTDDWENTLEMWEKMRLGMVEADAAFFFTNIGLDDIVVDFAMRFDTPVIVDPESAFSPITDYAAVKAKDPAKEFYAPMCWSETTKLLAALRAKKVIRNTRILLVNRFNSNVSFSSVDTFTNHELITKRLGARFRYVNAHELLDQMSLLPEGGNHTTPGRVTPNITPEDLKEAEAMADELIGGAEVADISRQYLLNSLVAYLTVRKNLDLLECNGFTAPCPDICSTRRINEMKFTFCLTHSLMMEQGIPSSCEYDADSVLSQQALIAVSGQCPYMGNTTPLPYEEKEGTFMSLARWPSDDVKAKLIAENPRNLYVMEHSVANRCYRKPTEKGKYGLRHFAHEQKFGAVLRYDFDQDAGQTVTLCRFSPDGSKLFIARGEVVCGDGYNANNCNNLVIFRVTDQLDCYKKQCLVGNHVALVYGDYTGELRELAEVLGVEPLISL